MSVHPFESAGLGLAPFRFTHMEHRAFQACAGAPVQVGGSCDYCGTGIAYMYWIESADGRQFKVGSDCVEKTDSALHAEVKAARRAERNAARDRDLADEEARERSSRLALADRFIAGVKGLREAFTAGATGATVALRSGSTANAVLADLHAKLVLYGTLSEKQLSFALKLGDMILNPRVEEPHVPAPEGRVTFRGSVVSLREVPDNFSRDPKATVTKMVVRVEAEGGTWLCWSTVPRAEAATVKVGDAVTVTATLSRGRDAYFAFGKRPVIWTALALQLEAAKAAKRAAREAKRAAREAKRAARVA